MPSVAGGRIRKQAHSDLVRLERMTEAWRALYKEKKEEALSLGNLVKNLDAQLVSLKATLTKGTTIEKTVSSLTAIV